MRTLVAGWFSFPDMGATAGDLLARDVACNWLTEAGRAFDIALAPPFLGGVRWDGVNATDYSHLVFVCGPFGNGQPVDEMLRRFAHCELIGLDLTMLDPLSQWNPFTLLLERDSDRLCRPDLALAANVPPTPIVALVLIHPQPEYGQRDLHVMANTSLEQVASEFDCARLRIDTRLDVNSGGLRSPGEVVAFFRAADVVLTTRLHGLVLALHSGTPVVAVDPVGGGAKVSRQAEALDWPWCFPADVSPATLKLALEECLRPDARRMAQAARNRGLLLLEDVHQQFVSALTVAKPTGRQT